MRKFVLTAAAVLASASITPAANAATIDVTTVTDEGINPGTGCSLREAVEAANQNTDVGGCDTGVEVTGPYGAGADRDTVLLDAATYNLTMAGPGEDLNGGGDVDVFGSGPLTIVGAGDPATTVRTDLADRIFDLQAPLELRLETLRVQNGNAAGFGSQSGGNLRADEANATLVLDRVTVTGGRGVSGGGIQVAQAGSKLVTTDSSIVGNEAQSLGGGIWLGFDSAGEITRTQIRTNNATTDNNAAQARGGGLHWAGDSLTVKDSSLAGNSVVGTDPGNAPNGFVMGGGANLAGDGPMSITGTTFSNNFVLNDGVDEREEGGALKYSGTGDAVIANSTFSGNAAGDGGNAHGEGGAVFYDTAAISGSLTFASSTFKDNTATGPGGDQLHTSEFSSAPITTTASILSGSGADPCAGDNVSGGFNVADPDPDCGYGASDSTSGSPIGLAAGPVLNGGPTPTIALDPSGRAVDFVPAAACALAGGVDQRGVARPNGPACDAGSFEAISPVQPAAPVPANPTPPAPAKKCKKAKGKKKKGKGKGKKSKKRCGVKKKKKRKSKR